jgi:hypothetical protein
MTEHMSDEYAAEVGAAALAVRREEAVLSPDHCDEHDPANQNTTGVGTGRRADAGKLRYDLIPVGPLAELARVYTLGAIKYTDDNWRGGIAYESCLSSMMRHVEKWRAGETIDPDGQHHMASVAFWAFAIMQFDRDGQEGRPQGIDLSRFHSTFAPVKV